MKAGDVSKENSVSVDKVIEVCKDLGIKCENSDSDISSKDINFIKTKIKTEQEKEKARKLKEKEANKKKAKGKIKLKRPTSSKLIKEGEEKKRESARVVSKATPVDKTATQEKPVANDKEVKAEVKSSASATKKVEAEKANKPKEFKRAVRVDTENIKPEAPVTRATRVDSGSRPYNNDRQNTGNRRYNSDRPYNNDRQGSGNRSYNNDRQGSGNRPYNNDRQGSGNRSYNNDRQGSGNRPYNNDRQGYGNRPYNNDRQGSGNRPYNNDRQGSGNRPYNNDRQGSGNRPYGNRPYNNNNNSNSRGRFNSGNNGNRNFGNNAGGRRPFGAKPGPPSETAESLAASEGKKRNYNSREKDREKDSRKRYKEQKDAREEFQRERELLRKRKADASREISIPSVIEITESITVGDLAKKMNLKANSIIAKLMQLGQLATINQAIDSETVEILCSEYGTEVKVVSLYDETVIKEDEENKKEDNKTRAPIVTVMGHVDHGKTRLLDTIRKTHVIDSEHGGITQHIGAYQVDVNGQKVCFLDTPGHAAFTTMRMRGASVTDIVVLIVAANDGVMPQTIEAINHAKAAEVPIVVAINKIDLPEANPEKVRQELANYGIMPEEWGGENLFVEISAKQNINIDGLLETVLMQAEMLELKANNQLRAKGTVLESRLDQGRGSVATVLVQNGTLNVGDHLVVGIFSGKVRAMFDDKGRSVQAADPSMPVEVLGINGVPSAGDPLQVVSSDKYSKQISQKRQELHRIETAKKVRKVSLENFSDIMKTEQMQELKLIIKADVDGSVQALSDALNKLSNNEIRVNVIHAAAGTINESDVLLASASNAVIIGYHVRPTARVADLADREKVSVRFFNIIFEVTQAVKDAMTGMLRPEYEEEVTGTGQIMQTFKVSKIGTIAGAVVLTGKVHKEDKIRVIRDGIVVKDGDLASLKRFKDDTNVVVAGQECGFCIENFNDLHVDDNFETYHMVEIKKTLDD